MSEVTWIVVAIEHGALAAAEALLPLVYQELRKLAAKLAHEKLGRSLQPTVLIHEPYLRLVGGAPPLQRDGRGTSSWRRPRSSSSCLRMPGERSDISMAETACGFRWTRPIRRYNPLGRPGRTQPAAGRRLAATGFMVSPTLESTRTEPEFVQHNARTVATDPAGNWVFVVDCLNTHVSGSLMIRVAEKCSVVADPGKKDFGES